MAGKVKFFGCGGFFGDDNLRCLKSYSSKKFLLLLLLMYGNVKGL